MGEIIYYIFFFLSSFTEISIYYLDFCGLNITSNSSENASIEAMSLVDEWNDYPPQQRRRTQTTNIHHMRRPRVKPKGVPQEKTLKPGEKGSYTIPYLGPARKGPRVSEAPIYPVERDSTSRPIRMLKAKDFKNANMIDLRRNKKTGRFLRKMASIDVRKDTIFITRKGNKYAIAPMRGLESNTVENIMLYRKQIMAQKPAFEAKLKDFRENIYPPLLAKYRLRMEYKETEGRVLMIPKIWWFGAECLLICYFIYCLYWYNYMWYNLMIKFHYYEKKMRKTLFLGINERYYTKEEYEIYSNYIKESLRVENIKYHLLIEKNAFLPLIVSIENYKNYAIRNNDFNTVNRLNSHLIYVIKFKKYFDKQIAKLRIKKKNELETFENKNTAIITHEEIIDFLG